MQCATCDTDVTQSKGVEAVGCTLRMSDARAFTDYRPRCHVQGEFYRQIGLAQPFTAYDSRMFLQKNAVDLMNKDRQKAEQTLGGCVYKGDFEGMGTMMTTEAVVRCTPSSCTRVFTPGPMGEPALGDRRAYG